MPSDSYHHVSIIIPVFNEEAVIGSLLESVMEYVAGAEIIVIDDGSTDQTTAKVSEFENVKLIRHAYNLGNGAAIKSGIRAAQGDVILMMDGDGQHKPEDIPRILAPIFDENYDMVVGARTAQSETELHRDLANNLYNQFASYIARHKVEDLTSGFRAIRGSIAKSYVNLLPNGFSYPTTLTLALFRSGFTVKYVPIVARKRVGQSKIKLLKDGLGFLLTILRIGTLFAPMRIFLPISLVPFLAGVGYGVYLLMFQHRFTNMPVLLVLSGLLFFVFGLISEQITLLRIMSTANKDL